jgi:hypothetical protein
LRFGDAKAAASIGRERAMNVTSLSRLGAVLCTAFLTSCAFLSGPVAVEATAEGYAKDAHSRGLVIFAVNWGPRWGCGSYQNARIMSFGFDRFPLETVGNEKKPDFVPKKPGKLTDKQEFVNYAYLMEPGEYALSRFEIAAARSRSEAYDFIAQRSDLIKQGQAVGGSFDVRADEIVYIGHFFVNCQQNPTLWRYYTEDKSAVDFHMIYVKQKYPFLDVQNTKYRLFRTKTLGLDHKIRQ